MSIKEVKEATELLINYVMVCENELGEDEHQEAKPISEEEHGKIEKLLAKLNYLEDHVDQYIFGSNSNGLYEGDA